MAYSMTPFRAVKVIFHLVPRFADDWRQPKLPEIRYATILIYSIDGPMQGRFTEAPARKWRILELLV